MPSWAQDALKLLQGPTTIRGSRSLNATKATQDVDTHVLHTIAHVIIAYLYECILSRDMLY